MDGSGFAHADRKDLQLIRERSHYLHLIGFTA
jgi:hypothetical protein